VIATSVDAPRAMPADDLAERWRRVDGPATVTAIADPIAALDMALARPGTTVVAGSLYLVGAVRAHLVDDPELRDPDPGATAR
jgi:folylpolyglutamate synthase/dihydropteroate synthase